jgi:phenylacetate-coenzyme A ligase PaaK-like adenylate-forming protein
MHNCITDLPNRVSSLCPQIFEADSADAADGLAHNIKVNIGVTAAVRLTAPGEIAHSIGKATRVVDLRPNG